MAQGWTGDTERELPPGQVGLPGARRARGDGARPGLAVGAVPHAGASPRAACTAWCARYRARLGGADRRRQPVPARRSGRCRSVPGSSTRTSCVAHVAPSLDRLAAVTGETVQQARLDGDQRRLPRQAGHRHPVRIISSIGSRLPAHATALGKALLAADEDGEVRALLHPPLAALTPRTLTEWEPLAADLAATRDARLRRSTTGGRRGPALLRGGGARRTRPRRPSPRPTRSASRCPPSGSRTGARRGWSPRCSRSSARLGGLDAVVVSRGPRILSRSGRPRVEDLAGVEQPVGVEDRSGSAGAARRRWGRSPAPASAA